jgi:hypothetical protein
MTSTESYLVFSGNRLDCHDFADTFNIAHKHIKRITHPNNIRGYRGRTMFCVGKYKDHRDYLDIMALAHSSLFRIVVIQDEIYERR